MLQQSDIDALLAALQSSQEKEVGAREEGGFSEIKIYDFARPDNLPSEFLHALENINSTYGRVLAGMLTGYLSVGVQVEALSIDQMTYRQFCNSVPDLTALATFQIAPLDGTALVEMNPHLAWYLLDRGLGGQGEVLENPREFTPLEKGLLDDLFRRMLRELGKSWESLLPLRPTLREVLTNPTIARVAQPDDRMMVCSFSISLPGTSGMTSYAIPVASLDFERLLSGDNDWEEGAQGVDEAALHAMVLENLSCSTLPVRTCLRDIQVTLGELAALQEGDVIHLDSRPDEPVEIRIGNQLAFFGQPVLLADKMAVEVTAEVRGA